MLAVRDCCCTADLCSKVTEHILSQIHHTVVVSISLIELHKCELRVVTCVNAFVSEYTADFVNSFKAAYDKTLEVELKRNTESNVLVESVVVCFERSCGSTACVCNKHWCFNLNEVLLIKEASDCGNNFGTLSECVSNVRVNDKINISLTVTHILILQAVPLFREREKGLGKESNFLSMNRNLALSCTENKALNTNDIADVPLLEFSKLVCTDIVHSYIYLHTVAAVTNVNEVSLAHISPGHNTSCNFNIDFSSLEKFLKLFVITVCLSDSLSLGFLVSLTKLSVADCHIILCDFKRIFTVLLHFVKLLNTDFLQDMNILFSLFLLRNSSVLDFFGHLFYNPFDVL